MMESLLFTLLRDLRNKAIGQPIELCLVCHQNGRLCHWSDSGNLILVACEESVYVLSYNAQVNRRIQMRRIGIKLVFVDGTFRAGVKVAMQAMRDRTIADFTLSVFSEIVSVSIQRVFRSPHYNNLELGRPWMAKGCLYD